MPATWPSIFNQSAHLLGAIKGATAVIAEANFLAALSTSTSIGPDYTPGPVEAAAAGVLAEIVDAISQNPLHPEWGDFKDLTDPLTSGDVIPAEGAAGVPRIGRIGSVLDATDDRSLKRASLDEVREYNRFKSTIYVQHTPYKFAMNADRIEHTREEVVIEVFCFERPATFAGDIPLRDNHEQPLVCGIVRRLAPREAMYRDLYEMCDRIYTPHLESIRALGMPQAATEAQAAPANV